MPNDETFRGKPENRLFTRGETQEVFENGAYTYMFSAFSYEETSSGIPVSESAAFRMAELADTKRRTAAWWAKWNPAVWWLTPGRMWA